MCLSKKSVQLNQHLSVPLRHHNGTFAVDVPRNSHIWVKREAQSCLTYFQRLQREKATQKAKECVSKWAWKKLGTILCSKVTHSIVFTWVKAERWLWTGLWKLNPKSVRDEELSSLCAEEMSYFLNEEIKVFSPNFFYCLSFRVQ